jgi:hypothetical protein
MAARAAKSTAIWSLIRRLCRRHRRKLCCLCRLLGRLGVVLGSPGLGLRLVGVPAVLHVAAGVAAKAPSDLVSVKQMDFALTAITMLLLLARARSTTASTVGSIVGGTVT